MNRLRRMLGGRHALLGAAIVLVIALVIFGVLVLADDDPPAVAEDKLPTGCAPTLPYITCTYTSSTKLSFTSMVNQLEAAYQQLDSSTPVWIQAWGGRGARGASSGGTNGGYGGYGGYAITVTTVNSLTGKDLYLYVGADGSKHANYSGQGGASTIVSTQALSQIDFPGDLRVLAGGSGGGGQSCGGSKQGRGGAGGVAMAIAQGTSAGTGTGPEGGAGGNDGNGGASGGSPADPGVNGIGGYGGPGNSDGSSTGWVNVGGVDPAASGWNAGAGGEGGGGGGGGGYGGGGGGDGCRVEHGTAMKGGGGGGDSYARAASINDPDAPFDSKQGDGANSKVVLTFNVS